MLTEKDYCDYETCVALKELGYKVPTSAYYMPNNNQLIFVSNPCRGGYVIDCFHSHNSFPKDVMTSNYIDAPTMWEAQKWLREEKKIDVFVRAGIPENRVRHYYAEVFTSNDFIIVGSYVGVHDSYEEALSEGIKEAIKILKEK